MERGSSKHGPHVDEELAREARPYVQGSSPGPSRADEWLEQEPPGEDQPERLVPGARKPGAPGRLSGAELEARSRLGRAVPRSVLPARRDDLLNGAQELDAPDDIVTALERLPGDKVFHTVYEIWDELGYRNE